MKPISIYLGNRKKRHVAINGFHRSCIVPRPSPDWFKILLAPEGSWIFFEIVIMDYILSISFRD